LKKLILARLAENSSRQDALQAIFSGWVDIFYHRIRGRFRRKRVFQQPRVSHGCWCEGVLVRRGVGAKGCWCEGTHVQQREMRPNSRALLRCGFSKSMKRRVADFRGAHLFAASRQFAACVSRRSDASLCIFNHARRLNAFMQMQNTFAGIKPYCDVCNPITHTMRLLTADTTRPVHIFLPIRTVATTLRKHDR
jgi:hypothetical protein